MSCSRCAHGRFLYGTRFRCDNGLCPDTCESFLAPTLHLTNWASLAQHGPRRRICAMARPRYWEVGSGTATLAHASLPVFDAFRRGDLTVAEYRERLEEAWDHINVAGLLEPGVFKYVDLFNSRRRHLVAHGDTLLCACPRPDSPRRRHPCHLEWLAPHLVRAGWRVVLYAQEFPHGREQAQHNSVPTTDPHPAR